MPRNPLLCINDVYFSFTAIIDVWQDGEWAEHPSDWQGFGWELKPGKSCVQPIPEPAGNLPWRIRLGIQESPRGLRGSLDRVTSKAANISPFPIRQYEVASPTVVDGRAGQDQSSEIPRSHIR